MTEEVLNSPIFDWGKYIIPIAVFYIGMALQEGEATRLKAFLLLCAVLLIPVVWQLQNQGINVLTLFAGYTIKCFVFFIAGFLFDLIMKPLLRVLKKYGRKADRRHKKKG
jgi:hypothetical protein